MSHPLLAIVLLPLAGFVINGLVGHRLGARFVSAVGCGLPIAAFALAVKCFVDLGPTGTPIIDHAYAWAAFDGKPFDVAFVFDRLSAVLLPS